MRRALLLLTIVLLTCSYASKNQLPPVPSIDIVQKKRQALRECKVPPQIAILPPQIDKDYRECVNSYYIPDLKTAEDSLKRLGFLQEDEKLLSIKTAPNFIRVYEFLYETKAESGFFSFDNEKKVTKNLLCDDSINNCYKAVKLSKKLKN